MFVDSPIVINLQCLPTGIYFNNYPLSATQDSGAAVHNQT